MIRWIPYTFVRTVLFFAAGIVFGFHAPDFISGTVSLIVVAMLTILYFVVAIGGRRNRHHWNPGWIALSLVFILGYIHVVVQTEARRSDHPLNTAEPVSYYQAVVTRFAEEKERTWKIEARMRGAHAGEWKAMQGRVMLYLAKDDFRDPFRYGDILLIRGAPQIPEGPANPGEFDHRAYLATKNICHQHFLRDGDVIKTGYGPPSRFMEFSFRTREWAQATLVKFVDGEREQAIAQALVLGMTDGLDEELLGAYSATGSMHVLAVSGLHVSILYFILLWIFSPLKKIRGGRWIVAIASLFVLWVYAFVTGLTPSVLRAVTMFSFFVLARPWGRSTNVYNTLAVSAFCLLLFDAYLLKSVGFQLSYLAVLGIVFLYPKIIVLWEPRHRMVTEVWKISAVAIAAQVATFPLGLLYFHQFPNYFLLSNLLVVPLSFVVLITGLLILVFSFFSWMGVVLGFCLATVIGLLNAIVFGLEMLPFSLTENVYITGWQCGALMMLMLMITVLLQTRKFRYAVAAFGCVIVFVALQWVHFARDVNVRKVVVYRIPGHGAIDLIDRGQAVFLTDGSLERDGGKMRFHIHPNRLLSGVRKTVAPPVSHDLKGCRLITWNGKTLLQVVERDFAVPGPLAVDWVVVGNNALPDPAKLQENVAFEKVILDSSNSFFFASRFMEEAKLYKLEVYSVLHQGAFISKLENGDT